MTTALGQGTDSGFGSGWISGVLAVTFGALAYGGVLCLLFPDLLTTPDARPLYPLGVIRFLIYTFLVAAFVLGALSALLRTAGCRRHAARRPVRRDHRPVTGTRSLGLDWFLLNPLVLAMLFVPAQRAFPLRAARRIFRPGWDTDSRTSRSAICSCRSRCSSRWRRPRSRSDGRHGPGFAHG